VGANGSIETVQRTNFFAGAVATNFKRHENEVVPQLLKLEKKITCGARFIIAQIGFDARKSHEMIAYLCRRQLENVPLIGNVFLLTPSVARFFRTGKIPGVAIGDHLLAECQRQAASPDRGESFFRQLAAKQLAIFRGLGFAGGYLGGVHKMDDVEAILDLEAGFADDDWRDFAREIQHPSDGEFYFFAQDPASGLADPARLHPAYEASLANRRTSHNVTFGYRLSKLVHEFVFTPGRRLNRWLRAIYARSKDSSQGPPLLRILEHAGKSAMFRCQDCGDCSLPDVAFLCPESQCAKNQRNGPCGGTRDGLCEVHDFECIWSRAYDRLKVEGREQSLLDHAPVIQDEALRGTSSWANALLGRDHAARRMLQTQTLQESPSTIPLSETNPIVHHPANMHEAIVAAE
jgi:methylenetetrahydrofolate reductase (NADPH)